MKPYPKELLAKLVQYCNEVRINGKREGNSIVIENCKADFAIRRLPFGKFEIENYSSEPLFVDAIKLDGHDRLEIDKSSVFIYSSTEGKSDFLFGFDPNQGDLWSLDPHEERGLEVRAENFTKTFRKDDKISGIEDIDFTIRASEFVGIYGGSGTGKTTLLESMIAPAKKANLGERIKKKLFPGQRIKSGKIYFDNRDVSFYAMEVAYLPQNIDLPQELKCKDLLKLAMFDRGERDTINRARNSISKTLSLCALDDSILEMRCGDLSGGQKRRIALAMALLKKNVRLLVLDEPTTGLDIENEINVMNTLKRLSRHGITVIAVTHSIAACHLFDRLLILRKTDPEHGAELCFETKWADESFKGVLNQMGSDAEKMSFLANPNSGLLLPALDERVSENWPYQNQSFNPQGQKTSSLLKERVKKTLSDFISRTTLGQFGLWLKTGLQLISKDRKSIKAFFYLAICCALIIQFGIVKQGGDSDSQMISMSIICAPWLCATYAAIFLTDTLRFFAWEKFSGLRAYNFVLGIFFAQIIPAFLISLVFSVCVYTRFNHEVISQKLLSGGVSFAAKIDSDIVRKIKLFFYQEDLQKTAQRPLLTRFLSRFMSTDDAERWRENWLRENPVKKAISDSQMTAGKQAPAGKQATNDKGAESNKIPESDEDANSGTEETRYEWYRLTLAQTDDDFPSLLDPFWQKQQYCRPFHMVFASMLFICMVGAALGIFSGALFQKAQSATVFLVVLFIFFLLFGRLFAPSFERCMEPISVLLHSPKPKGDAAASKAKSVAKGSKTVPNLPGRSQSAQESKHPSPQNNATSRVKSGSVDIKTAANLSELSQSVRELTYSYPKETSKLSEYQTNEILPWIVSFLSISRYAFVIVVYPTSIYVLGDFCVLFAFLFGALCLAIVLLTNKSKMWRILSPR